MNAPPQWRDELQDLLDRLQDGGFDEQDRLRLNNLLRGGPAQREFFITYMDVHSRLAWDGGHGAESADRGRDVGFGDLEIWRFGDFGIGDSGFGIRDFHVPNLQISKSPNQQILSPLTVGGPVFSYIAATLILGVMLLSAWAYKITRDYGPSFASNSRRSTTSGGTAPQRPELVFVARVTSMSDCRWSDPQTETYAGASVPLGRKYALASGLMEITYRSGAKVILEGPCSYEVESDRGGFLALGKLTARVESGEWRVERENSRRLTASGKNTAPAQPPEAVSLRLLSSNQKASNLQISKSLFAVRTPTAVVTDLGTEYGVEVDANGDTTSCVFQGKVVVRAEGSGVRGQGSEKRPTTAVAGVESEREVQLAAGESARVERGAAGKAPVISRQSAAVGGFVRKMPVYEPIAVFSTGVGLKAGEADPHWQIVARSDQPGFEPRPAVVTEIPPEFADKFRPNDDARSQWISAAGEMPLFPEGLSFTFRTTFELTGLPAAASKGVWLRGGFMADNHVTAIRLNGKELPVPEHGYQAPFNYFFRFAAADGFVEGVNVLEFDVLNEAPGRRSSPVSPMALRVELNCNMLRGGRSAAVQLNTSKASGGKEVTD